MSTYNNHSFKPVKRDKANKKKRYKKPKSIKYLEQLHFESKKKEKPSFPYPVKTKFRDDTANGLTKCVITYVRLQGGQAERINSTGRYIDNSKTVTDVLGRQRRIGSGKWIKGSGRKGTADISATIKGRSVKIEVKCKATGDNYQSLDQKQYQREVEASGGIYFIARDFTQFSKWYSQKFLSDE